MLPNLGFPEIIVLCAIGLLVFGPKKLPELGKSIGEAIVNFKKSFQKASIDEPEATPPEKNKE